VGSEFHEGTEICESKEYGRQYIELTRKYADLFKRRWSPPWPKGQFSAARTVSTEASGKEASRGLRILSAEDGNTTLRSLEGAEAWAAKPYAGKAGYIYFAMDDSFKWDRLMNATVEVEYFDSAPGLLALEYDGEGPSGASHDVYTRSATIELKGERIWKKATFKLAKAYFLNSQNGGADFRIVGEAKEYAVRKVTLHKE